MKLMFERIYKEVRELCLNELGNKTFSNANELEFSVWDEMHTHYFGKANELIFRNMLMSIYTYTLRRVKLGDVVTMSKIDKLIVREIFESRISEWSEDSDPDSTDIEGAKKYFENSRGK